MKEKYSTVAKTIARWKLDNWFENWLADKADGGEFWKVEQVMTFMEKNHWRPSKYCMEETLL